VILFGEFFATLCRNTATFERGRALHKQSNQQQDNDGASSLRLSVALS
jgi:hypothetical protein